VAAVDSLAKARGVSRSAIALAWLMTHPSKIVPIVGSTKPDRIKDAVKSTNVELSREEWYTLLEAARGERLP
jgi:predicted oxidoreductase